MEISPHTRGVSSTNFDAICLKAALEKATAALLIEVHPNPAEAWSDGAQQLTLEGFAKLMEELKPFIAAAGRE